MPFGHVVSFPFVVWAAEGTYVGPLEGYQWMLFLLFGNGLQTLLDSASYFIPV